jgi:hypothetical protein
MKNNIEQSIKESLKDYEMPYDVRAWESMSKALDQRMPVSGKSNWKWYLGGATILAIASIWFYQSSISKTDDSKNLSVTSNRVKSVHQDETSQKTSLKTTNNQSTTKDVRSTNSNLKSYSKNATANSSDKTTQLANTNNSFVSSEDKTSSSKLEKSSNEGNASNSEDNIPSTKRGVVFPSIQDLCQGETVVIKNDNDLDIFLSNNGKVYPISANKKFNFEAENTGNYFFGYAENGGIVYSKSADFKVKSSPSAEFMIDDRDKFENGVPTIKLIVNSEEAATYSWKIEGLKSELTGKEVKAHLYNKGNYTVTLTSTPRDGGCPSKISKNIQVDEDYNLLAVNSFWPQSNDPRNATFMPYALKERASDFTMLVIDPSNGATLFETNDATNGWTGINKGNGQLVDANKAFIWIVRLKNPLPGENSEYKGTIIRL